MVNTIAARMNCTHVDTTHAKNAGLDSRFLIARRYTAHQRIPARVLASLTIVKIAVQKQQERPFYPREIQTANPRIRQHVEGPPARFIKFEIPQRCPYACNIVHGTSMRTYSFERAKSHSNPGHDKFFTRIYRSRRSTR